MLPGVSLGDRSPAGIIPAGRGLPGCPVPGFSCAQFFRWCCFPQRPDVLLPCCFLCISPLVFPRVFCEGWISHALVPAAEEAGVGATAGGAVRGGGCAGCR